MSDDRSVSEQCCAALERLPGVFVRRNLAASGLTTFCIGGPFSWVLEVETPEALTEVLSLFKRYARPWRVIGAGSNLLVSDRGLDEWIVRLGRGFREVRKTAAGLYEIGAAASLMTLSRDFSEQGLSGLEFAGGIPASLGGALRMNAGAHGGQMADVVSEVQAISRAGQAVWINASELSFSYRYVDLPPDIVISAARLRFTSGDPLRCRTLRAQFLSRRKATQPLTQPSAGSVFRNPSSQQPAGLLLEQAGLKGTACGGARVSDLHANWIVNEGRRATAQDVSELMELCRSRVLEMFGINLEPEIVRW